MAVFHEVGMLGEVMILAMFEYEDTVGGKDVSAENEVGNGVELLQGIGWISKDEVEQPVA